MKYLSFYLIAASLVYLIACTSSKNQVPSTIKDTVATTEISSKDGGIAFGKAEQHYKTYCAGCHGEKMDAFVDRKWKHGNKPTDLYKSIKYGIEVDGMPAYDTTFTHEELEDLVAYIQKGIANTERYFGSDKLMSNVVKTESFSVRLDTVIYDKEIPWGMAFDSEGNMYYTERKGTLTMRRGNGEEVLIKGTPEVRNAGQGGMMDVELHPNFKTNKLIYLSYSKPKMEDGTEVNTTAVIRAKLVGNQLEDIKEVFEALPYVNTRHHYGSRLEFAKDGKLFISVGDRGKEKVHPQFLTNSCGKIHRINDDGSIPSDNPFYNTPDAQKSIYSYGHRNPQGIAVSPTTGALWETEHGPRGGDEVNICKPGLNYGWPTICYGINYNGTVLTDKTEMPGMEQPVIYWIPSIAPSGTTFVRGGKYPGWEGNLLVGSLRFNYLNRCEVVGEKIVKEELLFKNVGRMRDVQMGHDGYIYIATERPGAIYKVVPILN